MSLWSLLALSFMILGLYSLCFQERKRACLPEVVVRLSGV